MSNPQIVVEMSADEAKMWASFKKIETAEGGVEAALKAIGRATKEVSAENAKMERAATQTLRSIQTPQERYNQKLGELKLLYDRNKLSVDQYRRAVEQVENQYKRAGDAGEDAFGDKALRNLVQYTAGIASIAALLGKAVQMFHDLDAEAQAAFERMKDSRAGLAELAGLAKTPQEAQQLVDNARKAYEGGVGKSEEEAAGLHYKLKSTGLYDERKVFEDLAKSGVVSDVIPTIGATAKIQAAMGKKETGDATAVLSKLYQASDVTQYRMEEIARAAAEPALFAGKLGMKDEELLAQLAGGLQTLDVSKVDSGARAYYQALLQRGGFEGLSAEKQMAEVKKRLGTMDAEEQKKFFGSIEAQTFYEALMTQQGQQTFREQMVALPEAERTQLAIQKTRLPEVDTGLRRTRIAGEATRRREAQDIPEGRDRALTEAIIEDRVASLKREGRDVEAWVGRQLWGMTRFVGWLTGRGDKPIIESAGNFRDALSPDTQQELKRYWAERRGQTPSPKPAKEPGPGDLYEEERQKTTPTEPTPGGVTKQSPQAPDRSTERMGGPKPGDLITPIVPVPIGDLYQQNRRQLAESKPAGVPDRSQIGGERSHERIGGPRPGDLITPVVPVPVSDLYQQNRRQLAESKPAGVPDRSQIGGERSHERIGGPRPGDLITPVVPVPVSDLYHQERERTTPPEATDHGRAYRTNAEREMLGAKYATADPSTLPGGNPAVERQTDAIHEGNKLLKEIRDELSGHTRGLLPIDVFSPLPASSAANNAHRE